MRTTIRLDEDLLRKLKKLALEEKRTLNAVIEEAAREKLARTRRDRSSAPLKLTTFRGNGVRPGVDLDDSAALLDLMG